MVEKIKDPIRIRRRQQKRRIRLSREAGETALADQSLSPAIRHARASTQIMSPTAPTRTRNARAVS